MHYISQGLTARQFSPSGGDLIKPNHGGDADWAEIITNAPKPVKSHIATNLFGIPKMDMVQVNDLDDSVLEKMRSLPPPSVLQFSGRMSYWNEYTLSQELKDFLDSFTKSHVRPKSSISRLC